MRMNEILTYKELCEEFNEIPRVGGTNRERQMTRFRKKVTIDRINKKYFIISSNEPDYKIIKENNIKDQLLEFCKLRHITIVGELNRDIRTTDKVEYICNFHPDVIQESTVNSLMRSIGCKICKYPMSRIEVALFLSISNAIHRYKIDGVEFDINIPSEKILIEYNGYLYHNGERDLELRKKKIMIAEKYGYRLINIEESQDGRFEINGDTIIMPPYATSNQDMKDKIIGIFEANIPNCHFAPDLWNKAAEYMRNWKLEMYENDKKENKKIKQYDEQGNLINEFNGFNEIKELIKSGSAFGFNWIIK